MHDRSTKSGSKVDRPVLIGSCFFFKYKNLLLPSIITNTLIPVCINRRFLHLDNALTANNFFFFTFYDYSYFIFCYRMSWLSHILWNYHSISFNLLPFHYSLVFLFLFARSAVDKECISYMGIDESPALV